MSPGKSRKSDAAKASEEDHLLVTGGAGFLGVNLADRLAGEGHRVLTLDNFSRLHVEENWEWLRARHGARVELVRGDIRDAPQVEAAVGKAAAVFHLAAQVAVTTSLQDPVEDFEINARGTLNLLEAVRKSGRPIPFLYASTNKVYGRLTADGETARRGERHEPVDPSLEHGADESRPLDFHSPYGCSKGVADQYVRDYARVFGLPTVVFRMSCLYGPRQFGTEDQGWVAHFLISAITGRPITIYGDGYQVRDVLYVEDAVDAYVRAWHNMAAVSGRIFNLGGGPDNSLSLRELLGHIGQLRGDVPEIVHGDWRPGDQPWYISDIRALKHALEWEPRLPVAEGLARLHEWLETRFTPAALPTKREVAL